jgi:hypothetical protein
VEPAVGIDAFVTARSQEIIATAGEIGLNVGKSKELTTLLKGTPK